tara:strand:+ start:3865 stop:4050 length:186 start_codon:yes stop_codon:yes gene_type:complete
MMDEKMREFLKVLRASNVGFNVVTSLCPVHKEKTGSFVADFRKGKYQCFGCGVKGDVDESA